MKKRLIFDGQLLQTNAWYRGMGKYCLQMLHYLSENVKGYELVIIFNENIDCDPGRYDAFAYFCPNIKQAFTRLPVATDRAASAEAYKRQLTRFIHQHLKLADNTFVITSLFSWDFFAQYPAGCKKVLLFYDLTPMLLWKDLGGYFPPNLYMSRFKQIYEADRILTISETVRQDVLKMFGFEPSKVKNINGGFTKPSETAKRPERFTPPDSYILFVSGDLPHKNNSLAAKGFARFLARSQLKTKLVMTSTYSPKSQNKLKSICPDIVFSGNVSDEELEWLYENSQAILFASKYEGLGIPILDAVYNNKPVAASKIPVFEEMSKQAFYFFSPTDEKELAVALADALDHKDFTAKTEEYPQIMAKYTWSNATAAFLRGVSIKPKKTKRTRVSSKSIAVVSLHPGITGQLGRLSEKLYYWLSKDYQVDFFFDSCGYNHKKLERPTFLDHIGVKVADVAELTVHHYKKYKEVIYLADNRSLDYKMVQTAAVLPGMMVSNFELQQLSGEHELVMKVVVANQKKTLAIKDDVSARVVAEWLRAALTAKESPSKQELIIRSSRLNSAIMNKLLRTK